MLVPVHMWGLRVVGLYCPDWVVCFYPGDVPKPPFPGCSLPDPGSHLAGCLLLPLGFSVEAVLLVVGLGRWFP